MSQNPTNNNIDQAIETMSITDDHSVSSTSGSVMRIDLNSSHSQQFFNEVVSVNILILFVLQQVALNYKVISVY